MSWTREQVSILLGELTKHTCLYAVKTLEYKNKHARAKALKALQEVLPGKSQEDIKNKIHGLRTTFINEHRKYTNAIKSGVGEEDIEIFKPTLWYYKLMLFLLEHMEIGKGRGTLEMSQSNENDEEMTEMPVDQPSASNSLLENRADDNFIEDEEELVYELDENTMKFKKNSENKVQSPELDIISESKPLESSIMIHKPTVNRIQTLNSQSKKGNKRTSNMIDATIGEASGALKSLSRALLQNQNPQEPPEFDKNTDEYATFGHYVVQKLRKRSPDVAEGVEQKIMTLLFEGLQRSKE